ncbi:hypothetical protein [Aquabacterium sp. A08]|nr:hypothetical protein [Aquabacterium sp. A08]
MLLSIPIDNISVLLALVSEEKSPKLKGDLGIGKSSLGLNSEIS